MVRRLFALALSMMGAGCFADPPPLDGCPAGQPGCACDDGSCAGGSICMASLGRCVPEGCAPGTHTCVCASNDGCDGNLVCEGGVCLEDEMTSATADSQASSAPGSSTGAPTVTSDVTEPDPATEPPTSGTSSPTSTETGVPPTSTGDATTTGPSADCLECIESTWGAQVCNDESDACKGSMSCVALQACYASGGSDCCNVDAEARRLWATYLVCAMNNCNGSCDFTTIDCG